MCERHFGGVFCACPRRAHGPAPTRMTTTSAKRRVAIVVPALPARGGLASVALFLHRTIAGSDRYEPHLISLATSSADADSVRLLAPWTWLRGPRVTPRR